MNVGYLVTGCPYDTDSGAALKLRTILEQTVQVHDCSVFGVCTEDSSAFAAKFRRSLPRIKVVRVFRTTTGLALRLKQMCCVIEGRPPFEARGEAKLGAMQVAAAVGETGMDVLHIDGISLSPLAARVTSIPVVTSITDAVSRSALLCSQWEKGLSRRTYFQIQARFMRACEERLLTRTTITHVVSPVDAAYLKGLRENATVRTIGLAVPGSVLRECDSAAGPSGHSSVLIVGNFRVRHVTESTRTIIDSLGPGLRRLGGTLTLLGRGVTEKFTGSLDEHANLHLCDYAASFAQELCRASVIVLPDVVGTGLKTRALYGLATRRPVVGTPTAFEGMLLNHNEHCVTANSVSAIAEAVLALLNDPERTRRIGSAGRAMVEARYSEETIGHQWLALYEEARLIGAFRG
jgi:hypothetical protein